MDQNQRDHAKTNSGFAGLTVSLGFLIVSMGMIVANSSRARVLNKAKVIAVQTEEGFYASEMSAVSAAFGMTQQCTGSATLQGDGTYKVNLINSTNAI